MKKAIAYVQNIYGSMGGLRDKHKFKDVTIGF